MPPITLAQWGPIGLTLGVIVWFIYAVLKGHIVPKSVVDEIRKDRDARLAEALAVNALWKEAAEAKNNAVSEMTPMIKEIRDDLRTMGIIWQELRSAAGGAPRGD